MNSETAAFIHSLFAHYPVGEQAAFLTLTAIHPDGDHPTPSRHVPLGDEAALERALERLLVANARGWGAYIGLAPRQSNLGRWSRGGKGDLLSLPALFADLDTPDDALVRLAWFDLPPSCVVFSGHGYHAYWYLEEPTRDFASAERALRGLARCLGGDDKMSVAQSLRLVGTRNTKAGRENALCSVVRFHPERRYALAEFAPYMRDLTPWNGHPLPRRAPAWNRDEHRELSPAAIDSLTDAVLHLLEGRPSSSGYIRARCPLPHAVDRPGMHFTYFPSSGWGYCFGKHSRIPPQEMRRLLTVVYTEKKSETGKQS